MKGVCFLNEYKAIYTRNTYYRFTFGNCEETVTAQKLLFMPQKTWWRSHVLRMFLLKQRQFLSVCSSTTRGCVWSPI